jgi:DNA-binding beta-propeller fold protein YncE
MRINIYIVVLNVFQKIFINNQIYNFKYLSFFNMSIWINNQESKLYHVYDFKLNLNIQDITLSPDGKYLLVCLVNSCNIRKIFLETKEISILPFQIQKSYPESITFSPDGTFILVCDVCNNCIYKVVLKSGNISIFAGVPGEIGNRNGPKEQARFDYPLFATFSFDGTYVLVCEHNTNRIRKIDLKSGKVSTFAGIPDKFGSTNGPKEQAMFDFPTSLTFSPDGTFILVCDFGGHCIRKIDLKSGQVSTFAGVPIEKGSRNGLKEYATFYSPRRLTFSPDGTFVLVCSKNGQCIRKICLKSGLVSTFAGIPDQAGYRNGPKEQALFKSPRNIIFSKNKKFVIICDRTNIKYIKIRN